MGTNTERHFVWFCICSALFRNVFAFELGCLSLPKSRLSHPLFAPFLVSALGTLIMFLILRLFESCFLLQLPLRVCCTILLVQRLREAMAGSPSNGGGGDAAPDGWWVLPLEFLAIVVLAFLSTTFNVRDLGLMSLDPGQMEIVTEGGDAGNAIAVANAQRAKKILPARQDGNLLLCIVLLGNVAVGSCLAILLDAFAGGGLGFVITTFLVVTLGEITPQVVCHRHGLYVGELLLPILKFFLCHRFVSNGHLFVEFGGTLEGHNWCPGGPPGVLLKTEHFPV